jgi:hypothetical protein
MGENVQMPGDGSLEPHVQMQGRGRSAVGAFCIGHVHFLFFAPLRDLNGGFGMF